MKKSEILKLVENLGEEDSINELLVGTDVEEQIKSSSLTLENFKQKASDKEFKAYLDSLNDKHAEKVISTMKEKGTWENQFKDVLEKKYPDLFKIEDPVIKQLKAEMDAIKAEKAAADKQLARENSIKEARQYANEKKYPTEIMEMVDLFVGENAEASQANLDKINTAISEIVQKAVNSDMKGNAYQPGGSGGAGQVDPIQAQVNSILGL